MQSPEAFQASEGHPVQLPLRKIQKKWTERLEAGRKPALLLVRLAGACQAHKHTCLLRGGQSVGQWWCSAEGLGLADLSAHCPAPLTGPRLVHTLSDKSCTSPLAQFLESLQYFPSPHLLSSFPVYCCVQAKIPYMLQSSEIVNILLPVAVEKHQNIQVYPIAFYPF